LKLAAIILSLLLSSFIRVSGPAPVNVYGVWKGYFGTENEVYEISMQIDQQNQAEITCYYTGGSIKTKGTYKLLGNHSIIISCLMAQFKSCEIVLYGNLNPSASFIMGDWDGTNAEKGCFYMRKLLPVSNP